jgi:putative glycosyltransferase (TIGR04348 family)
MEVSIICPARPGSQQGNRMTARRWADILRELGHRVRIAQTYRDGRCDLLIALHAKKSAAAAERFHRLFPDRPLVIALTGTDIYRDIHRSHRARRVLGLATRIVVLQPLGIAQLPWRLRPKARVIYQSARRVRRRATGSRRVFEVCVVGHLRAVKDPLRTALAARRLPPTSRIRVEHLGTAMSPGAARRARAEESVNPRYRWLGERPHSEVGARLARARLMVISSRMEGGANVISEALAASVPVLASRIPGNVGLLGAAYPGYFERGDTRALAALLERAETDRVFYRRLALAVARRSHLASPDLELRKWRSLLRGLRG